jgi:hypothetical protein
MTWFVNYVSVRDYGRSEYNINHPDTKTVIKYLVTPEDIEIDYVI